MKRKTSNSNNTNNYEREQELIRTALDMSKDEHLLQTAIGDDSDEDEDHKVLPIWMPLSSFASLRFCYSS